MILKLIEYKYGDIGIWIVNIRIWIIDIRYEWIVDNIKYDNEYKYTNYKLMTNYKFIKIS